MGERRRKGYGDPSTDATPMADASALMEIDDDAPASSRPNKGKIALASDPKSVPWVEKYRPQSLADVAAHRDIIDTSIHLAAPFVRFFFFFFFDLSFLFKLRSSRG